MEKMRKLLLVLRTLRYVKPIQIWNRIWRKRLSLHRVKAPGGAIKPLPEFTFLNVTAKPEGWNDARMEKLWLYNLHYMADCNEELILRWIEENPVGWGNGWEPYPISLRVVNWVKWLVREKSESKLKVAIERSEIAERSVGLREERICQSLVQQVRWLENRLEYHLLANHLLANAKALVFAGAYLGGHIVTRPTDWKRWLKKGLAIYRKELPEQTCADGVNFERSPMYHCIILEDLLDCVWILSRGEHGERGEEMFREYAEKMIAGLKLVMGPDGKIAKFNDSTEGIAKQPSELFEYAEKLNIHCSPSPSTFTSTSGFVRKEAGAYVMLAKCGEIGPKYQPGHAHADTFSFELWRDGAKIVGDTGCSTYVPGAIRSYERSTAAHNTVIIDGENSSEVWAAHRVGRRFDFGKHRRVFELTADGLKGTDEIWGKGEHEVEVRFHLPPSVNANEVAITCPGERRVETCAFAVGWNKHENGTCIIYKLGHAGRVTLPTQIEWTIK